jgi:hypothetical protein
MPLRVRLEKLDAGAVFVNGRDAKLCDIAAELRHETDRAFLIFDGDKKVWLPKSMVEHCNHDGADIFTMPTWLAQEKELI